MNNKKKLCLLLGPALFLLFFIPFGLDLKARLAFGTIVWMGVWWVTLPVHPAITAFLPVVINAVFSITSMENIIKSYSAELIFLLAGADIITMAWEATGVDKLIAAHGLRLVGTSVKQQVVVWFLLATALSAVLPNTVVAAILCSIAISMLKFVGEGDVKKSAVAPLVLMAIVWGANNGGMLTPLGGSMNLITVSYIEGLISGEFMYTDWVVQLLPFGIVITIITLAALMFIRVERDRLEGSKEYFEQLLMNLPRLTTAGKLSLAAFVLAAGLSFSRQLYQAYLPDLKPGFIFLIFGGCMFLLRDDDKKPIITWKRVEQNMMWGMFFLFAGGTALGALVNGSGAADAFAGLLSSMRVDNDFLLILIIVTMNVILSDVINNTACAAVTVPIIISIAQGLGKPVIPYLWIATVSYNISYTLPTSIRAIPIGYGLEPQYMFKRGLLLSLVIILATALVGWGCIKFWPGFGTLTIL